MAAATAAVAAVAALNYRVIVVIVVGNDGWGRFLYSSDPAPKAYPSLRCRDLQFTFFGNKTPLSPLPLLPLPRANNDSSIGGGGGRQRHDGGGGGGRMLLLPV